MKRTEYEFRYMQRIPGVRPHLRRFDGRWHCMSPGLDTSADTMQQAHAQWRELRGEQLCTYAKAIYGRRH